MNLNRTNSKYIVQKLCFKFSFEGIEKELVRGKRVVFIYLTTLTPIFATQIWSYKAVGVGSVEKFMRLIGFRPQIRLK